MIDYPDAVKEMFQLFYDRWIVDSLTVGLGYAPEMRWQGVEIGTDPDVSKYWVRISQQTAYQNQSTFRNESLKSRHRINGLIIVQLFCPKSDSESMQNGRELAQIAKKIYQNHSTSGNIWFRNAVVKELTPENLWNRFNIVGEYRHDEEGD